MALGMGACVDTGQHPGSAAGAGGGKTSVEGRGCGDNVCLHPLASVILCPTKAQERSSGLGTRERSCSSA